MLMNYLSAFIAIFKKYPLLNLINIVGLTLGTAAFTLILAFASFD